MVRFVAWLAVSSIMPAMAGLTLAMLVDLAALFYPAYSYHHIFFLVDAAGGPFLVIAAFPAAALSLGVAFLLARFARVGRNGYVFAGAAAGLAHSVFADWSVHHHATRYVTNGDIYEASGLMLGAATSFEVVLVCLAVIFSGAISGLIFGRFCKDPKKSGFNVQLR